MGLGEVDVTSPATSEEALAVEKDTVTMTWEEMMVVKVDRLGCSLAAVLAGGTEPKRSVMVTVVKALV